MAVNDPISSTEYNNIRQAIAARVGDFGTWTEHSIATSTTTSGYGRNFVSDIVVGGSTPGVSDRVTSAQMFDLYLDLQAGYVHQTGSQNTTILPPAFVNDTSVEFADIADFNTIANAVTSFNHSSTDFDSSSFTTSLLRTTLGVSCTSTRNGTTNPWGTGATATITHRVTVNFGTHNALLYFMSAGGELRFDASLTGGTSGTANTKDWDWAQILSAMGTIRFGRVGSNWRTESVGGTGTGSLVSVLSTGAVPSTVIFTKQGGVSTAAAPTLTAVYDNNAYRIKASTNTAFATATQLIFQIEFDDADLGSGGQSEGVNDPVDEQVTGNVTSNVYTYTPSSDFVIDAVTYPAIQLPTPSGTVNSSLV
jgi:hypothetical protein